MYKGENAVMWKILLKAVPVNLKRDIGTYILMGILVAAGMYIASAFSGITYSYVVGGNEISRISNSEDGQFQLVSPLTEQEERSITQEGFQFLNLLTDLNVRDNIRVAEKLTDKPMEYGILLEQLGLSGIEKKYPNQLSGGQQQRVAIARVLIKNPRLLLCDEPTGALDSATAKETLILLEKINAEFGTTILMVTHNQVIPQMMRQNFTMKDGLIIENRVNEHPVPAGELEGL